jgi:two-component system OmpR family response regulator
MDGLELLLKIRENSDIPVIISSARDDINDKVIGLERGADDYLPKPYNPRELEARIRTVLKRQQNQPKKKKIEIKKSPFEIDWDRVQIRFHGELLILTPAEFDILTMLIERKGGAISRETFMYESENIDDDSSEKNIDVMVSRIRRKLSKIDKDQSLIKPVRGVGYQLILP